jgi:outer membrane protein
MISKFARFIVATAFAVATVAMAQTPSAAAPLPSAPSAGPAATSTGGTRIGTINLEQAIFATNEGQRDFEALSKKLEPKQTELKGINDEVDGLKKQLNTQGDKMNEQARATLVKQIETKQKSLDRQVQDAREDAQGQQNEIAQRILQKLAPMLVTYAQENGFGVILDTSNPWPNGPVVWAGQAVDVTKAIVDGYNAKSGVPAPTRPAAGATGGATTTKPAAKPAATTPTPK